MSEETVTIQSNERVAVVGKTGTGKTYLTRNLMWEPFETVIFYDWKWHHYQELHAPVVTTIDEVEEALFGNPPVEKFVYAPEEKSLADWDKLCSLAWEKANTHIIADELKGVYQEDGYTNPITDSHEAIMTRGRVRGVGITNTSQRPKKIPMETMSEAEHFFAFRLNLKSDRDRIREIVGEKAHLLGNLKDHKFMYYNTDMEEPRICEPI